MAYNYRRALVFFGTPHRGPVNSSLVSFGKLCARLVQKLPGNRPNDIMDALEDGLLFSDTLKDHFRHQLESYRIVSFWEGLGDVSLLKRAFQNAEVHAERFRYSLFQGVPQHLGCLVGGSILLNSEPIIATCADFTLPSARTNITTAWSRRIY